MASVNTDHLTPFGQLALRLDHDFSELNRLSGQIERLEIETDSGLELAIRLLGQFAKHGQGVSDGIKDFAKALESARREAEKAATVVAERAALVQRRQAEQDQLRAKFQELGARVQETSSGIAELKKRGDLAEISAEEKTQHLRDMESRLTEFAEQAKAIQEEARQSRLRKLEREADSLFGTLQSAKSRIGAALISV